MEQLRPFTPRTERAVGRTAELATIRQALTDPTQRSYILYFVGPGGIGKTRLLEEAARLAGEQPAPTVLYGEIIDLYHSELHSVGGVQAAVVAGLDPQGQRFSAYRAARARFDEHRLAGGDPKSLRKEERGLDAIFLSDYNQIVQESRILLRFDTTELIQRESDPVLEACQIEEEEVEVRNWLLDTLPRLESTVVMLSGRPPAPLFTELKTLCADPTGPSFPDLKELTGLTLEESLEYFSALEQLSPQLRVPDEMRTRIWKYTGGHPIRLSLAIDLFFNGHELADLFPPHRDSDQPSVSKEEIESRLVDEFMRLPRPIQGVLRYLALARKGLDADLLYTLAGDEWDLETCRKYLEQMRRFTVVKTRPGTDVVFMHDELYALLDRHVLRERQHFQYTYEAIAGYYEGKLAVANTEERRVIKPTLLYYRLQGDPWEAFWRCYVRWDEEAVRAFDFDLDMRLRDELLRFLKATQEDRWVSWRLPRDLVDRDAAVRWVRRYLSRGDHRQAADVARRIQESDESIFLSTDPLYLGALQTAYAEALIYTGAAQDQALALLGQAIEASECWRPEDENDPCKWWQARILGRAYNNRGYIYWQQGRNEVAIREFRKALWHFREADIRDEMADTLTNLGFVYARWGRIPEAESMLLDAIDLRKELGLRFAQGLSVNALGLTYVFRDDSRRAVRFCNQALKTFESLNQPRGIGLAHSALGLALRKRGEQWKEGTYSPEEGQLFFEEAIKHLTQAEEAFSKVPEPLRLWEIYNEWGSLYCDWGWLLLDQGRNDEAQRMYDLAVEFQLKSVKIAERHGFDLQVADSYDDLSQIYADRGAPADQYEKWLDKIRVKVPPEYVLEPGGFRVVSDPVEGWWLVLGKIYLGYGVRAMRAATEREVESEKKDRLLDEATDHYARAIAYYQKYSPKAAELDTTLKSVYRRLKTVRVDRLQRLRGQIADFGETYSVDMSRLLELLDATLGLEPPAG